MIVKILRSAGAIIAGLVVAFVLIVGVEFFSAIFHPFPPGADPSDMEVCKAHVANYPGWVLGVCGLGWILTVFVSTWLATRLGTARHPAHGIVVGVLLFAAAGFNMLMLPYPIWFELLNVILFPSATLTGVKLSRRPVAPESQKTV